MSGDRVMELRRSKNVSGWCTPAGQGNEDEELACLEDVGDALLLQGRLVPLCHVRAAGAQGMDGGRRDWWD